MNRELGGNFDLASFRHRAFYNVAEPPHRDASGEPARRRPSRSRDGPSNSAAGETIHTENSYKYTVESFRALAAERRLAAGRDLDRRERLLRGACAEAVDLLRAVTLRPHPEEPPRRNGGVSKDGRSSAPGHASRRALARAPQHEVDVMPICEVDPWRMQYFEHVACPADVLISTEDADCWTWYPRHRWVYDKVAVALSQGLEAAPHGVEPPALSGLLQADHQPEGHGRRQPRAARRRRLRQRTTRPATCG